MGVYIPNEDMPKDCYTCFCYETEFNMCSLTGKRLNDIRIRQDACPLIEIDLVRCGECKHFHYDMPYVIQGIPVLGHEVCDFWGDGCKTSENGFCSYAERRADEHTDKRD